MNELKGFSLLTEEVLDLGVGSDDALLELGDMQATGHPNLIVYLENPPLQKWVSSDG